MIQYGSRKIILYCKYNIFIFDAIQNSTVTYRTTIPHDVAT